MSQWGRFGRRVLAAIALAPATWSEAPARAAPDASCGTIVIPSGLGFAEADSVNTLHPLFGNGLELATSTLLYRPLVAVGADHHLDWRESLASSVAPNGTDTAFTITLRPATWSDGQDVTAADVLYTWRLIEALGPAYEEYGQGGIPDLVRDITAPDRRTVRIRMLRPVNPEWFEDAGLPLLVPLPEHAWGPIGLRKQEAEQSEASFYRVVDGAFRLASLAIGRDAVFTPNPSYLGHPPNYSRLVLRFFNGSDALEALRTGQVDAANLPALLQGAGGPRLPGFDRVPLGPLWLDYAIVPNLANPATPFFGDAAVRHAIARAIDQRRVIRLALHGAGIEQHGFVPASWTGFLPPDEHAGRSPVSYDPGATATELDRAGWRRSAPGAARSKDGQALAFTVLVDVDDDASILMMQIVQEELAAVGIRMRIHQLEFNQLMARVVGPASGWDAVLFSQPSSAYPDATSALATDSADNYGRFSDPVTDRLIALAIASPDPDPLYRLERRIEAEQPVIFLPAPSVTVLRRRGLDGIDRLVDAVGNWRPEYLSSRVSRSCGAPRPTLAAGFRARRGSGPTGS